MGDTPREKKKKKEKKEHEGEEVHEEKVRKKKLSKGSGSICTLVVTDHDEESNSNNEEHEGEHKKKKKHHHHHHHDNDDENTNGEENAGEDTQSSLLKKKKKKKKDEEGNDTNEEGGEEGEKDKEKSKEDGLLATLEKRKKEREKKANSLRFRRSFKANSSGGTGTVILPKKSRSQVSNREGYSHDDLETSPRKKHSSLDHPGPRPALSTETGLRAEENKPDKLSRWASLKGIRDGFLRSQSEEHKRGRSFSGSAFTDNDELESTANPLVALAQRQQMLEQKKEREILSESMNLDERTRMRNKVINEIINTERDYINDLTRVIKLFFEPLTKEGILTPEECKDIFSNIKLLVNVNNALLDDLWKQAKETNGEQLGQSFVLLSHYLKMYSQYCGNQKVSREAVTNALKTNNRFKVFIEKQTTLPELNNLTLKDYLIKPVQRLCKYPLLLRELLKYTDETHPDYEKLKAAFENIQEAVESVNSQKQTEEEMEEVAEMLNTLIGAEKFGVQLMVPGRKFVKEGVVKTTSKDHTTTGVSHYFMFSDLLILAEDNSPASEKKKAKKAGGPVKREVTAMLPFGMCLLNEIGDDEANGLSNLVEIIQSTSIFTFYFESATEKTEWTKDLKIENLNDDEEEEKEKKGGKKKHKRTTSHS